MFRARVLVPRNNCGTCTHGFEIPLSLHQSLMRTVPTVCLDHEVSNKLSYTTTTNFSLSLPVNSTLNRLLRSRGAKDDDQGSIKYIAVKTTNAIPKTLNNRPLIIPPIVTEYRNPPLPNIPTDPPFIIFSTRSYESSCPRNELRDDSLRRNCGSMDGSSSIVGWMWLFVEKPLGRRLRVFVVVEYMSE